MQKSTIQNSKAAPKTNNSNHSPSYHILNEALKGEKSVVPISEKDKEPSCQGVKAKKEKEGNSFSTNYKENELPDEESIFLPKVNIYEPNENKLFESLGFCVPELSEIQKQSIRRGVAIIKLKKIELNDTEDFIDTRFFKLNNELYIPVIELYPNEPYNYYLTNREFFKKYPGCCNERMERDLLLKGDIRFIYEKK